MTDKLIPDLGAMATPLLTTEMEGNRSGQVVSERMSISQVRTAMQTGGTVTVSTPLMNGTQTWNDGAVAFTAIKTNITATASAATSLLLDLQVGGATQLKVDKAGALSSVRVVADGEINGSLAILGCKDTAGEWTFISSYGLGGVMQGAALASDSGIQWDSGTNAASGSPDLAMVRASASRLKITDGSTGIGTLLFKLPTSDPAIVGALWNNAGTITISAG